MRAAEAPRAEPVSVTAFAGAIIIAIGLLLGAAIHFAVVKRPITDSHGRLRRSMR
jgi:hypothetical protein